MHQGGDVEKPRVLLLAPSGVTAVNIDGIAIYSGLGINCKGQFYPLNEKENAYIRNKLSEVKLIFIDEISIVSMKLFGQLNQRLI